MNNICSLINRLVKISLENNLIDKMDEVYTRNRILALLKEDSYTANEELTCDFHETLGEIIDYAVNKGIIEDSLYAKDIFGSNLMNVFMPTPSGLNREFNYRYNESPSEATKYFYSISKNSNYVRTDRIAKNVSFKSPSQYGEMEITINLSKPEKDPKQIALEKNSKKSNYPTCLLCVENEGYEGTVTHPDRANHRMVRLHLNNKDWMLQYSPYLYYNEHCILLCTDHTPMSINKNTFVNLLEFVDTFPHYFAGSNADLPIVGGSILAHEHYQGGNHTFPMNTADTLFGFELDRFPSVKAEAVKWPLSTVRLRGENISELVECSNTILGAWRKYTDEAVGVLSHSNNEPHNTITPIVRKENNLFVVDLVLRNNRTSEEHPLGIFHPHFDVQHIKKENIGLIEVMGLAVLPGRLLTELEVIKSFLNKECDLEAVAEYHRPWAQELRQKFTYVKELKSVDEFVNYELGNKFVKVLEYCGVFPLNEEGIAGFKRFTTSLNN